jgi:heterodisulfide reductase subunit C
MAIRVNPKLIDEMEQFGGEDVTKCYHCGNCTAVCPHSESPFIFPRRSMRTLQMGLEDRLKANPGSAIIAGSAQSNAPGAQSPARP